MVCGLDHFTSHLFIYMYVPSTAAEERLHIHNVYLACSTMYSSQEENLLDVVLLLIALLFEDTSGNVVRMFEKLEGLKYVRQLFLNMISRLLLNFSLTV